MKKFFNTKLKLLLLAVVVSVGVFFAYNGYASNTSAADCSNDAVIKCGAQSVKELREKYNSDFTKGTKNIFEWFGINSTIVNTYKVENGVVYRNGNVYVGDKLVATNAVTAGRMKIHDVSVKREHKGTTFYTHSLNVFRPESVKAFVYTDKNGKFVGAVMLDCGNPVKGTPVEPPKPEPKYSCVSVSRIKQSDPSKYVFRAKSAFENGAKATGFTFEFGDGKSQRVNVQRTENNNRAFADVNYTYVKAGTYNVKVTAHFNVNGKAVNHTSANCQKPVTIPEQPKYIEVCRLADKKYPVRINEKDFDEKLHSMNPEDCEEKAPEPKMIEVCRLEDKVYPVTIKEEDFDETLHSMNPEDCEETEVPTPAPTPEPTKPVVKEVVTELPRTGIAESLSGVLGLGALTTAMYYYVASRRN